MAFGAALGFVGSSLARDLGFDVEIRVWTERLTAWGAVFGMAALVLRAAVP
jgi:hypothetical protein